MKHFRYVVVQDWVRMLSIESTTRSTYFEMMLRLDTDRYADGSFGRSAFYQWPNDPKLVMILQASIKNALHQCVAHVGYFH
jgi:hypothetical protein